MARLKRASTMVKAPRDMTEANEFLARIGAAMREREAIERGFNDQVAGLRDVAEGETRPLDLEVDQLTKGLQLWAEANRPSLTRDDATKTVTMAAGIVAWRVRPPKVNIKGVNAVIETLQRLALARFLRTKVEIDKDAMLKEPAAASAVPGVTIGSEGEEFIVTPASVDLPDAAVAA